MADTVSPIRFELLISICDYYMYIVNDLVYTVDGMKTD